MSLPSPDALQTAIHESLRQWHDARHEPSALLTNLIAVQDIQQQRPSTDTLQAVRQLLQQEINRLAEQNGHSAEILRRRFLADETETVRAVAVDLARSTDNINRQQRQALEQLAHLVLQTETQTRARLQQALAQTLPTPSYTRFIGQTQPLETLKETLLTAKPPWLTAVTGLGGIGKTALAIRLAHTLVPAFHYTGIIWIQLNNPGLSDKNNPAWAWEQVLATAVAYLQAAHPDSVGALPAGKRSSFLQSHFQVQPYLLIIDNLEQDHTTAYLLDKLKAWVNPTQVLFTTRGQPTGLLQCLFVLLSELNEADSLTLLREEARQIQLDEIADADDDTLQPIYEQTGGNPQALKLVLGMLRTMPLTAVLIALSQSQPGPAQNLFGRIYQQAWQTLSEDAQELLTAMPLVSETGAGPEELMAITELDAVVFWTAVNELTSRSLLEVRGTIQERRYSIHRLTQTFLQNAINQWPTETNP